jgi:hypothetical protein
MHKMGDLYGSVGKTKNNGNLISLSLSSPLFCLKIRRQVHKNLQYIR